MRVPFHSALVGLQFGAGPGESIISGSGDDGYVTILQWLPNDIDQFFNDIIAEEVLVCRHHQ